MYQRGAADILKYNRCCYCRLLIKISAISVLFLYFRLVLSLVWVACCVHSSVGVGRSCSRRCLRVIFTFAMIALIAAALRCVASNDR